MVYLFPLNSVSCNSIIIICQITLVNEINIFYTYKQKNRSKSTYIAKNEVGSFNVKNQDVVLTEKEPISEEPEKPEKIRNVYAGLSFAFSLSPAWLLFFIPALICAFTAIKQFKQYPEKYKGRGWAYAGMILGFIGLAFFILTILVLRYGGCIFC